METIASGQRCLECGKRDVYPGFIAHSARVKHDGNVYEIVISHLHVLKCRSCGDLLFDDETDEQISQALRDELHLLSPAEIRKHLDGFGWSQKVFAEELGTTPETVSRWLSGARIQSHVMDKGMRNLFALESLRRAQTALGHAPQDAAPALSDSSPA